MKQTACNTRSLMVAIAACGIGLAMVRWCNVNSRHHALLFGLGPLCDVYLHRVGGGNGIAGGAMAGIASGVIFVGGAYLGQVLPSGMKPFASVW
jgi:hypothetical protein